MNESDRIVLDHVFRSIPTDTKAIDFKSLSLLGRAALAMGAPAGTLVDWYKACRGDVQDRVDNLLFLLVDEPEVGDLVDQKIESGDGAGVLEDLVRAGVPWSHPKLADYLHGDARVAAAWLLAETVDEGLWDALDSDELDIDFALDLLRPGALLGIADLWDVAANLRDDLEPGDHAARLDAFLCCFDPDAYMRRVVQGRSTIAWLGHAVSVADAMHTFGPTSWLDTLAILEGTKAWDAFEFAASLAIAGVGTSVDPVDEAAAEELAMKLLDQEAAEAATSEAAFGFATCFADDVDLQSLYVEAAAHEELLRAGFGSPGLAGLPLSGGALDAEAVEAAREFLEQIAELDSVDDDYAVGSVRTLCDLAYWALESPDEIAPLAPVVEQLREHGHVAVKVAAEQAHTAITGEQPDAHGEVAAFIGLLAHGKRPDVSAILAQDGCLAFATAERLAAIGEEWCAKALVHAWQSGAFVRADAARMALRDVLSDL